MATGAIVGGAVGGAAVLGIIAAFAFFLIRRRNQQKKSAIQKQQAALAPVHEDAPTFPYAFDPKYDPYAASQATSPQMLHNGSTYHVPVQQEPQELSSTPVEQHDLDASFSSKSGAKAMGSL